MKINYLKHNDVSIAVLEQGMIVSMADALDLIATAGYNGTAGVVVPMELLTPEFFDLKTRLAGDILQKCVNYGMRIAIVGDFSGFTSKSLADFIRESNRGRHVFFKATVDEATNVLVALDD